MNWETIRNEFETTDINIKSLAEKHGIKESTLRSRKSRGKWQRNDATQRKTVASKSKIVATKKHSQNQHSQQNRSGNPNPSYKFPKHNSFASIHDLYSKYLHPEQVEIASILSESSLEDKLWIQIELQFSSIIRMQKVMWVEDADDHLKVESGYSSGETGSGQTFKVAFAYERYEAYIRAQSRAMAEYRNLIKHFLELSEVDDERRLKLAQMQLNINKTKVEIDKLKAETKTENKNVTQTIIYTGEDEMRRVLAEKEARKKHDN